MEVEGARALYASFDIFPSAKGASTHIAVMASTLFELHGGGILFCLADDELPLYQKEEGIEILRMRSNEPNLLKRALAFGNRLDTLIEQEGESLEICHFRDPWSGVPILQRSDRRYRTIYEVNGLPSIELPSTRPMLSRETLGRIRGAESFCWSHADQIITPSRTIAENLVRLGAPASRIEVIPNGADLPVTAASRPDGAPDRYLLYIGALQRWQGVETLLRAFALLGDLEDLRLVVCSSVRHRFAKPYLRLAERLGIAERTLWHYRLGKQELARWLTHATISVAPLSECSRNIEQGCAPLKILESMAHGVPVIASDLPAVREIMTDGAEGLLVRADRPSELARSIRSLLEEEEARGVMGERGRQRIATSLTWEHARERFRGVVGVN